MAQRQDAQLHGDEAPGPRRRHPLRQVPPLFRPRSGRVPEATPLSNSVGLKPEQAHYALLTESVSNRVLSWRHRHALMTP
jgi:hypothetical protein